MHEAAIGRSGTRVACMSQEFGGHGVQSAYDDNAMAIAVAAKRRKFSLGSLKSGDRLLKAIKNDFRKTARRSITINFAGTATAKL